MQKLLKQLRCLWSFDKRPDAQVLRTLEELVHLEELAVRALKNLAVRALLRNLVVRALRLKHLVYEQASLAWISSI